MLQVVPLLEIPGVKVHPPFEWLTPAPLESLRFGMKIFRGTTEAVRGKSLRAFLLQSEADVAIIRTPGDGQAAHLEFERSGFPFLHADTLVSYEVDLQTLIVKPLRNEDLEFVPFHSGIEIEFENLIKVIFGGYRNHYMANPFFSSEKVLEGIQEWALDFGIGQREGCLAWLVRRSGHWVAFATCKYEGNSSEGVLFGVHPSQAGAGFYSDLIRFTQAHFKGLGFKIMTVSTQVHNLAVQKVWSREGFVLSQCLQTWHINSMLTYSAREPIEQEFVFTEDDINKWGQVSGDMNPLHFDDDYAKSLGLPMRIGHGLVASGWISRVLGTEFPGPGTLFQSYNFQFFNPMLPGTTYRLRLSTLHAGPQGFWKCLAKIQDGHGQSVLLAYLDLLLKGQATVR